LVVVTEMVRTHVLLPKDVVEEIDRSVGERRRSAFLTEAARRELRRARQRRALEELAGSLKDVDVPGWETPESTAEWVRQQRRIETDPWEEASRDDVGA
jgi:hypothetical protein